MDDAEKSRDQLIAELKELRSQIEHLDANLKDRPDGGGGRLFKQMDDLDAGIQIIDNDYRFIYVNKAAARQSRQPKEAIINKRLHEVFPGFEQSPAYQLLERCITDQIADHILDDFEYGDGEIRTYEVYAKPMKDFVFILSTDVTENKGQKEQLSVSERRFSSLVNNLPGLAYRCLNEKDWPMEFLSKGCLELTGYAPEELSIGGDIVYGDIIHPDDKQMVWDTVQQAIAEDRPYVIEFRIITKSGAIKWVWEQGSLVSGDKNSPGYLEGIVTDITERREQQEAIRSNEQTLQILFDNVPMPIAMFDREMRYLTMSEMWAKVANMERDELIGMSHYDQLPDMDQHLVDAHQRGLNGEIVKYDREPLQFDDGTTEWFRWEVHPWHEPDDTIGGIVIFSEFITERVKALQALEESEERYRTLVEQLPAITYVAQPYGKYLTQYISPQIGEYLGFTAEEYVQDAELWYRQLHPEDRDRVLNEMQQNLAEHGYFVVEYRMYKRNGEVIWFRDTGHLVRDVAGNTVSLQGFMSDISKRKRAELVNQAYVHRIESLLEIEKAMSTTLDFNEVLDIIMDELHKVIPYDAIGLQLLQQDHLEAIACRGFISNEDVVGLRIPFTDNLPFFNVIQDKTPQVVTDIARDFPEINSSMKKLLPKKIRSWLGVPMLNQGEIMGLITLDRFKVQPFTEEEIQMAMAVASHAAMAIDKARLLEGLQETRKDLEIAYDATIEGWSVAMDLRDRETEGHTRRVTEVSLALARQYGFSEEEITHLRRGSLLHDIGKIGVPDSILNKPGPLNDEEWLIMRRHPELAYDMLSKTEYLLPSLEIPYCHHEKWDGSGYPQGLRGEEIPIAARIFAVADVWDALRSDRPYRKAWDDQKALDYIIQNAGSHFDPNIVNLFVGMMEKMV